MTRYRVLSDTVPTESSVPTEPSVQRHTALGSALADQTTRGRRTTRERDQLEGANQATWRVQRNGERRKLLLDNLRVKAKSHKLLRPDFSVGHGRICSIKFDRLGDAARPTEQTQRLKSYAFLNFAQR